MSPDIGKYPVEYYGQFYENRSDVEKAESEDYCPFLDDDCKKRTKTTGESIGTCSVGYRGRGQSEYQAHCICPHRFETPEILSEIEPLFVEEGDYFTEPEVPLLGTSIDYIAGKRDSSGEVLDFAGVEIQALDTTGSVWPYREAYFAGEDMAEADGTYGMNWAMSLTKTMMQQAFKKGQVFRDWGENLIFLIQDVSLDYIRDNYDVSGLRSLDDSDPVHFYAYSLNYDYESEQYKWEIDEKVSSTIEGVTNMMVAPEDQTAPTKRAFQQVIQERF